MKTFTNPRRFVDFTRNYLPSNAASPHVLQHFLICGLLIHHFQQLNEDGTDQKDETCHYSHNSWTREGLCLCLRSHQHYAISGRVQKKAQACQARCLHPQMFQGKNNIGQKGCFLVRCQGLDLSECAGRSAETSHLGTSGDTFVHSGEKSLLAIPKEDRNPSPFIANWTDPSEKLQILFNLMASNCIGLLILIVQPAWENLLPTF